MEILYKQISSEAYSQAEGSFVEYDNHQKKKLEEIIRENTPNGYPSKKHTNNWCISLKTKSSFYRIRQNHDEWYYITTHANETSLPPINYHQCDGDDGLMEFLQSL